MKKINIIFLSFLLLFSCRNPEEGEWRKINENPDFIHRSVNEITQVMLHDIYSPPVASRIYAYISVAGYEAALHGQKGYPSLVGKLNGLKVMAQPDKGKEYCYTLSAVEAITVVGKKLIMSEGKVADFHSKIMDEFKNSGMPEDVFENSIAFGDKIAKSTLAWAAKDKYKQTRSLPKYEVSTDSSTWKPTPPGYMKAVEPHWNLIRTFVIDSASQFRPVAPVPFSTDKKSPFYKMAVDVYNIGLHLTPEQKDMANFWDCNPFKMSTNGHVMFAVKKISPGGHWMNVAQLICKQSNASYERSAQTYAYMAVVIADVFISCWEEKYRTQVIRPETYINQYIDQSWTPTLQTPPFPEYTSGHSVVSAASAQVLTKLYGDNFNYTDSTEVEFGISVRKFKSFKQAANEAAMSRFYGGIHYMPAITTGLVEGAKIGDFAIAKLGMK